MSKRRFRPTDAFVDESIRGQRYWMSCVFVEVRSLAALRAETAALASKGKRRHFSHDTVDQRREALNVFSGFPVRALVVVCNRTHGVTEFAARNACLSEIVRSVQAAGVERLKIESRQDDSDDRRTVQRARTAEPVMVFEHVAPMLEPLLWVADAVAWAAGGGVAWRALIDPIVSEVVNVRP
jgi:hypothetical protein